MSYHEKRSPIGVGKKEVDRDDKNLHAGVAQLRRGRVATGFSVDLARERKSGPSGRGEKGKDFQSDEEFLSPERILFTAVWSTIF